MDVTVGGEISTIRKRLERDRRQLLDLSARNRLISTPRNRSRSKTIEIVDELSEQIVDIFVRQRKRMTFLPGRGDADDSDESLAQSDQLVQPDDDVDENGIARRHTDTRLQTRLTSEGLQKRLLSIFYDARTLEEEQGINVLYVALGLLKWFESPSSEVERYAPLLLIPVQLDRQSTNSRFNLAALQDDVSTNLSLQAKLHQEFGVNLPDVPELEELSPQAYFADVERAVGLMPRWEVCHDDMLLGFFSFSKFLMYRDLDPENWPDERRPEDHELLGQLLETGFRSNPPLCDDEERIDDVVHPGNMVHVMDADSSQTLVIEEARQGRNLVIQGPPGTGKSQTITNLIATAVKEGRTVLFVAEKMAALDVVKSRLDRIGLGAMCLELHSHKANKREVLKELERTLELPGRKPPEVDGHVEQLQTARYQLNAHADTLHRPILTSGRTAYDTIGELVRLQAEGVEPADFTLQNPLLWSAADFDRKLRLLEEVLIHRDVLGPPLKSPWRGIGLSSVIRTDLQRCGNELTSLLPELANWLESVEALGRALHFDPRLDEVTPARAEKLGRLGHMISTAPKMDRTQIADDLWVTQREQISRIVKRGATMQALRGELEPLVAEVGWETDVAEARRAIAAHGASWIRWFRKSWRTAQSTLRGILTTPPATDAQEQTALLDQLIKYQSLRKEFRGNSKIDTLGQQAFGHLWNGTESDWPSLAAVMKWVEACETQRLTKAFRQIAARCSDPASVQATVNELASIAKLQRSRLETMFRDLQLDENEAFGVEDIGDIPIETIRQRLEQWRGDLDGVSRWVHYRHRRDRLRDEGMDELADRINADQIPPAGVVDQFRIAYFETLLRQIFVDHPSLAHFDGESYERLRQQFADLDLQRIELARKEVAAAHISRIPSGGEVGEMKVVRRQIKLKSRHMAIRRLLSEAGHAIQGINRSS